MEITQTIANCALFRGLQPEEIAAVLPCLSARQATFRKGQFLLREGDEVHAPGVLLTGEAEILQEDFWGNRNLLAALAPGEIFGEVFACAGASSPVSAVCRTDGSVMYLNVAALLSPCEKGCAQHKRITQNLIRVLAQKNLMLNEKTWFLSQRTTREKLLCYLSAQARKAGSASFRIPFGGFSVGQPQRLDCGAWKNAAGGAAAHRARCVYAVSAGIKISRRRILAPPGFVVFSQPRPAWA